ncbi:MAG: ABC transporter substrate-binding protein [Clostridia bacterium]|nr:ABC transporter substrate-binding protein [Clostridia bacterium]
MKKLIALLLALVFVFAAASCGSGKPASETEKKKIVLCLDYTPNTNHSGIFAAEKNGYFADENLEVEIIQPEEGTATELCAAGKVQLAIDFQDYLAPSYIQGLGITAVAAIVNHNTAGILAREGELETPKGLEGDKYATYMAPIELAMTDYLCKNAGGDPSKINYIQDYPTNAAEALKNKVFDSLCIYYAWDGINAEMTGKFDFAFYKDYEDAFDYYSPVIIANNDFLANDAETARAALRAIKKGYEFAIENPDEAAEILIAADETGALAGREEFVKKSQRWISGQYVADGESWGVIDAGRWDAFYKWCYENKAIDTEIPAGTGFSNDYLS